MQVKFVCWAWGRCDIQNDILTIYQLNLIIIFLNMSFLKNSYCHLSSSGPCCINYYSVFPPSFYISSMSPCNPSQQMASRRKANVTKLETGYDTHIELTTWGSQGVDTEGTCQSRAQWLTMFTYFRSKWPLLSTHSSICKMFVKFKRWKGKTRSCTLLILLFFFSWSTLLNCWSSPWDKTKTKM